VLERLVSVGKRGMRPITVIVLKGGDPAPDAVAALARDSDTVGPLADGGLVVICPDTAQPGGLELANRLLQEAGGVSAGVASVPMCAMDAEELLVAAIDAATSGATGVASAAPDLD
jgi:hypothetical protein